MLSFVYFITFYNHHNSVKLPTPIQKKIIKNSGNGISGTLDLKINMPQMFLMPSLKQIRKWKITGKETLFLVSNKKLFRN